MEGDELLGVVENVAAETLPLPDEEWWMLLMRYHEIEWTGVGPLVRNRFAAIAQRSLVSERRAPIQWRVVRIMLPASKG